MSGALKRLAAFAAPTAAWDAKDWDGSSAWKASIGGQGINLIYYDNRSFDAAELERLARYAASDSV